MRETMSYLLEEFVERIEGPVICVIDGVEYGYASGKELAQVSFEKRYVVSSISTSDKGIVLVLVENTRVNETTWAGDERWVSFF